MANNLFITGNQAVVMGALAGGGQTMFGYPITPSTEILEGWIKETNENDKLKVLQTEDETSAGFAVCGALLAGNKAFTATAGPGHILMQDPLSMAENLRLPFVGIIMQRGGPSTGTVNYSQQEVNLAAFGGNGDGLRIVYSASTVKELYDLTAKAFSVAWKYRFPTLVLGDGYLAKMKTRVHLIKPLQPVKSSPILKENPDNSSNLRNCFSSEESFGKRLEENLLDWEKNKIKIVESEIYKTKDATELIVAHGLVAEIAKDSVDLLRKKGRKIGLFRPITLNPLDGIALNKIVYGKKRIFIIESSKNQFSRIIKYELAGKNVSFYELSKPAQCFSAEEILNKVQSII